MSDVEDLEYGQRVYDGDRTQYIVVEVLDEIASEYIVKPEVKDRGHTIYKEKTVADFNSEYPADDRVVAIKEQPSGRTLYWPISRVETEFK